MCIVYITDRDEGWRLTEPGRWATERFLSPRSFVADRLLVGRSLCLQRVVQVINSRRLINNNFISPIEFILYDY